MNTTDWLVRLRKQGKLTQDQLHAAAKFERLVYSGFPNKSPSPDRGGTCSRPQSFLPSLAGLRLRRLPRQTMETLMRVLIYGESIMAIGYEKGALSRTSAHRYGLRELQLALNTAAVAL